MDQQTVDLAEGISSKLGINLGDVTAVVDAFADSVHRLSSEPLSDHGIKIKSDREVLFSLESGDFDSSDVTDDEVKAILTFCKVQDFKVPVKEATLVDKYPDLD